MDKLEAMLRRLAVDEDDDIGLAWEIKLNSLAAWVTAATLDVYDSPEAAFQAALVLRDNLLAEGFAIHYRTELGAQTTEGREGTPDQPNEWRGTLSLGLVPVT